ncbi:hypothetical protein N7468_002454 [Penicillium chermesinum]|uniref:Uncharacterized protein n=1 Tax=Penicillium chermesinum TaxID=63820 RepID=A0A9W9PII7_9EURO|nr:uncharacterized protein N7468_002454 [Penicillium chermesinum]KAJ5247471.1 hypothetical protein N7468_002454 [Penicillium chermesinum]KAJ6145710.1 hypothetical protein N7470_009605 [Penicillium chermesinum]
MRRVALRASKPSPQGSVCQFCQASTASRLLSSARLSTHVNRPTTDRLALQSPRRSPRVPYYQSLIASRYYASDSLNVAAAIRQIEQKASVIHKSDRTPSNEDLVGVLEECQKLVESLVMLDRDQSPESAKSDGNEVSSLLGMAEKKDTKAAKGAQTAFPTLDPQVADSISKIATELLKDEKVFISPEALEVYTKTQTLLRRAEHFPEIFHLYANKPVPEENSSPIKYHKANPKNVNSAVPAELANMALDVAIAQKNLPLVLAIIDNTFCAPAFHRAKIFRKAGIPLAGLAGAPLACYVLASWAATFQNTMDPSTATGIAFAASLAYVGGTASLGIVAITTANDQMERVVWLPGIPLRHRWLREEERAAMDRVAVAWGFKDPYMRGEETGEEWESLREFIGMRGMILDKTELMPGME